MSRPQKPPRLWQRKDDGAWIIIDAGKQIRTGCGTGEREEAEKKFLAYLNSRDEWHRRFTTPDQITLGEILANYADDKGSDHKAPDRTAYAIQALAPFWGSLKPIDVSIQKSREYETHRNKSSGTVRRELGVLNAALNYAEVSIGLQSSTRAVLPKKPASRHRWFTLEEVEELRLKSPAHLDRFILLSVLTGRRKSSILDLRWKPSPNNGWIDLDRRMIHFLGTNETETSKRRGSITMPDLLLHQAEQWITDGKNAVIHYKGKPISDINTSFEQACKTANIKGAVPHTLKHTAITWAFQNGMTIEDAADYFSTSIDTLMTVYRQHSPKHQQRAVRIMEQIGGNFIANKNASQETEEQINT